MANPKLNINKNIKPEILLEKLHAISEMDGDDKVSFKAFSYTELKWVFLSLIDFGGDLSVFSKENILDKSLKRCVKEHVRKKKDFLEILNSEKFNHNKRKEKDYFLLTSLSINSLPMRKISIGKCTITITGNSFPKKFKAERAKLYKLHYNKKEENDYLKVVVHIKAKDFKDAFEIAHKHLEIFRGLLCLNLNSRMEIPLSNYTKKPINRVITGEFASIHIKSGELVHKSFYWYVPDFRKIKIHVTSDIDVDAFKKKINWLVAKYNKCREKHRITLNRALRLYVDALDESNKYISFLKSWTVLEMLTNTDSNDVLIKRCVGMFRKKDQEYQKLILEGLRYYRNENVHKGLHDNDLLIACYLVQEYIYYLVVEFNLKNAGEFNSIYEVNEYLDYLNPDEKTLKSKIKFIQKAIKIKQKS